jgi:hypothetical protein
MAGLTTQDMSVDPCCAAEQQAACCEPGAKGDCCGRGEGCGCAAAATTTQESDEGTERRPGRPSLERPGRSPLSRFKRRPSAAAVLSVA